MMTVIANEFYYVINFHVATIVVPTWLLMDYIMLIGFPCGNYSGPHLSSDDFTYHPTYLLAYHNPHDETNPSSYQVRLVGQ